MVLRNGRPDNRKTQSISLGWSTLRKLEITERRTIRPVLPSGRLERCYPLSESNRCQGSALSGMIVTFTAGGVQPFPVPGTRRNVEGSDGTWANASGAR